MMIRMRHLVPLLAALLCAIPVDASRMIKCPLAKVDFDVTPDFPAECSRPSLASCGILLQERSMRRQRHLLMDRLRSRAGSVTTQDYKSGFIEQDFDHFNRDGVEGRQKWRQRFYYANEEACDSSEVNFLLLGGEGPLCGDVFICHFCSPASGEFSSAAAGWAREKNATVYALEHRFYGDSNLTDGAAGNVDRLQLLTAEQALADAAVFIQTINHARNFTNPKWIVFGGSYPGSLAAWMRLKYPELVNGAVASSAPVQAKMDFYEYLQTVEKALQFYAPAACAIKTVKFFALAESIISTPERKQRLGICDGKALSALDEQLYFSNRLNSAGYVQEDDPQHGRLAIMCSEVDDGLNRLAGLNAEQGAKECESVDFIGRVECTPSNPSDYYWTWQTCNEFGYFATSELGKSSYSVSRDAVPVSFYGAICEQLYGPAYNLSRVHRSVQAVNDEYGGADKFNATNVVFINGSEDPWHMLSILDDEKFTGVRAMLIPGASHCKDFYESDEPEVLKAQALVSEQLDKWLA